jgi:sodium-dependent phosphate cotransporter
MSDLTEERPEELPRVAAPAATMSHRERWLRILALAGVLYVFLMSIELIGDTFKLMGDDFARSLFEYTLNPFSGLLTGILATSLVQSSSTVTSIIVSLVASGSVGIEQAVPMVMGANIGTSITNTIVSLGHMTAKQEFQRAFAGATVHDFFNLLAVAVFLPLELATGFLHKAAVATNELLVGRGGVDFDSPLKQAVEPTVEMLESALVSVSPNNIVAAFILLVMGLALLIGSLRYLVRLMKSLMMGKVEVVLHRYLFKHPIRGIVVGAIITILVQSSSVTTSLTIPLLAAGFVSVENIFPFVLGANVGTTITALLASMVTGSSEALTVALCHVYFNIFGILGLYWFRRIPIALAKGLGRIAVHAPGYAIGYVLGVFFLLPVVLIWLAR